MDIEKLKKVIDTIDKAVKNRDWKAFEEQHTTDVISYSPMRPEPTKGVTAHVEAIQGLFNAFPDLQMTKEQSFGQGDWICATFTFTGTHKGPLPGPNGKTIPPTNKPIKMSLISTMRFEDGKIAEEHTYFDRLAMLDQLGITP
jgi:predicted ester cyclase